MGQGFYITQCKMLVPVRPRIRFVIFILLAYKHLVGSLFQRGPESSTELFFHHTRSVRWGIFQQIWNLVLDQTVQVTYCRLHSSGGGIQCWFIIVQDMPGAHIHCFIPSQANSVLLTPLYGKFSAHWLMRKDHHFYRMVVWLRCAAHLHVSLGETR